MTMSNTTKATLAGLTGYGIWGFSFLFSKVALDAATPFSLLSIRFILAFLALNVILLTGKVRFSLKGKPVGRLLLLGLVQPVIYFICETYGIDLTSTSFSGIIIGMSPVVGLIFGVLFLKESCTAFRAFCTVMSVVGAVLTTTGGLGNVSLPGFLFLLGALVSAATFVVLSRSIAPLFTPFERTYVMFALGSVSFTAIAFVQNLDDPGAWTAPMATPGFWGSVLYLAVISSVCAFMLINYAVNYLSAGTTMIFSNFSTVISVLSGIFIMHDKFVPLQLVGIIIITLSVFGVSYQKEAPAKQ